MILMRNSKEKKEGQDVFSFEGEKWQVMPTRVAVRFRNDDYDNMLLGRPITCDDGSVVQLTVKKDWHESLDARSTVFRRTAEVLAVGSSVTDVEVGDIAIMDYKVDNDNSIIIGHDDIGKVVCCIGVSTYYEADVWRYANRQNPKDMLIDERGTLQSTTDIMGVIRDGVIIAKDPYVFMKFQPAKEAKVSFSGIIYEEQKPVSELEVIAVSKRSKEQFDVFEGCTVVVKEADTFPVEMPNGETYLLCNDSDVKLCKDSLKFETMDEFINALK